MSQWKCLLSQLLPTGEWPYIAHAILALLAVQSAGQASCIVMRLQRGSALSEAGLLLRPGVRHTGDEGGNEWPEDLHHACMLQPELHLLPCSHSSSSAQRHRQQPRCGQLLSRAPQDLCLSRDHSSSTGKPPHGLLQPSQLQSFPGHCKPHLRPTAELPSAAGAAQPWSPRLRAPARGARSAQQCALWRVPVWPAAPPPGSASAPASACTRCQRAQELPQAWSSKSCSQHRLACTTHCQLEVLSLTGTCAVLQKQARHMQGHTR